MVPIQEVLSQLRNTDSNHYSLEELLKRPEGLNPLCLESYLSAEDFKVIFRKTFKLSEILTYFQL